MENQTESNTQTTQNTIKPQREQFYFLIMIQLLVILISTILPAINWCFSVYYSSPRAEITFEQYCDFKDGCDFQKYFNGNGKSYRVEFEEYEDWQLSVIKHKTSPNNWFYVSQVLNFGILICSTIFRGHKIVRRFQQWLYFTQLPLISILIQFLVGYVNFYYDEKFIKQAQFIISFLFANVILLYVNETYSNFNLKKISQKIVIFYLIVILSLGVGSQLGFLQSNFTIQLLIFMHIQFYLLKTDSNLFIQNNKYLLLNLSLFSLIVKKVEKYFFNNKDLIKNADSPSLMIHKKFIKFNLIGFVLALLLRDYFLNYYFLSAILGFFLIIIWDTSIISTRSQLKIEDQHLAAMLFLIDICNPIRSCLMGLFINT